MNRESMVVRVIAFLKGLFGGGSWGLYLVAMTVIGAFMLERGHMKSQIAKKDAQIQTLTAQKDSALLSAASLSRTYVRRSESQRDLDKTEDEINALPQTRECANSKPIRTVISGMRDNQRRGLAVDTEHSAIRVPGDAESSEPGHYDRQ